MSQSRNGTTNMPGKPFSDVGTARWLVAHRSELADHLPHPRCAWRWSEVGLSQSTLEHLKRAGYDGDAGLIERAPGTEYRWQTTPDFWDVLPEYVDVSKEEMGTFAGQVRTRGFPDAPTSTSASRRSKDTRDGRSGESMQQATLGGDEESVESVRDQRSDEDGTIPASEQRAAIRERDRRRAAHPDQATLDDAADQ